MNLKEIMEREMKKFSKENKESLILINEHETIVRGYPAMLLSYFAQIAKCLLDCEGIKKEDLIKSIDYATMSDKELEKLALEKIKKMIGKLEDVMKKAEEKNEQ